MRGARNARIVVANRLLALPGELLLRQGQGLRHKMGQILLDPLLVLRRWRHDLGVKNGTSVVESIAVIQNAAWGLGAAIARGSPRLQSHGRLLWRFIGRYQA